MYLSINQSIFFIALNFAISFGRCAENVISDRGFQYSSILSEVFIFILVSSNPLALYIVPSPHWQPSAKLTIRFICGAFFFISLKLIARALDSLFFGSKPLKAIRLSSINSFRPVPSTNQISLLLSVLGQYCITPPNIQFRNTPKCSWLFGTTFPL